MDFGPVIDLVIAWLDWFRFWIVIRHWEGAVVLRFGKFTRELKPGIHLICPFGIHEVWTEHVALTTTNLPPQSVTTKDGHSVTVAAVVSWRVANIQKLILDVDGREEPVLDACAGAVATALAARSWAEIHQHEETVAGAITKAVHRRALRYGVDVVQVQFTDLVKCRGLRLWSGAPGK